MLNTLQRRYTPDRQTAETGITRTFCVAHSNSKEKGPIADIFGTVYNTDVQYRPFQTNNRSRIFSHGITRTFYVDHFKQITDRGYSRRGITRTFYVSLFNTKVPPPPPKKKKKKKEKDSNKLRFANILAGFGPFYGIAAKNSVVI